MNSRPTAKMVFPLIMATTAVFEGLRAGAGTFRLLLDLPARFRIGPVAFADFSRATDCQREGDCILRPLRVRGRVVHVAAWLVASPSAGIAPGPNADSSCKRVLGHRARSDYPSCAAHVEVGFVAERPSGACRPTRSLHFLDDSTHRLRRHLVSCHRCRHDRLSCWSVKCRRQLRRGALRLCVAQDHRRGVMGTRGRRGGLARVIPAQRFSVESGARALCEARVPRYNSARHRYAGAVRCGTSSAIFFSSKRESLRHRRRPAGHRRRLGDLLGDQRRARPARLVRFYLEHVFVEQNQAIPQCFDSVGLFRPVPALRALIRETLVEEAAQVLDGPATPAPSPSSWFRR